MRLIDVDALKADYRMADECKDCQTPVRTCEYDRVYTKMDFCEWLDSAPTVQPERKKGDWEYIEKREPRWDLHGVKTWAAAYRCSKCGFIHTVIEDFGIYKYCPNCGSYNGGKNEV